MRFTTETYPMTNAGPASNMINISHVPSINGVLFTVYILYSAGYMGFIFLVRLSPREDMPPYLM